MRYSYKQAAKRMQVFFERVYQIILASIPGDTMGEHCKLTVEMTNNYTSYCIVCVDGEKYVDCDKCIDIRVHDSGNVTVDLSGDYYCSRSELLFTYVDDKEAQGAFLRRLAEILSWLIRVYLNQDCFTFNTYMQYLMESDSITSAYMKMVDDYRKYYGNDRCSHAVEVEC